MSPSIVHVNWISIKRGMARSNGKQHQRNIKYNYLCITVTIHATHSPSRLAHLGNRTKLTARRRWEDSLDFHFKIETSENEATFVAIDQISRATLGGKVTGQSTRAFGHWREVGQSWKTLSQRVSSRGIVSCQCYASELQWTRSMTRARRNLKTRLYVRNWTRGKKILYAADKPWGNKKSVGDVVTFGASCNGLICHVDVPWSIFWMFFFHFFQLWYS